MPKDDPKLAALLKIEADMKTAEAEFRVEMSAVTAKRRSLLRAIIERLDKRDMEKARKLLSSI